AGVCVHVDTREGQRPGFKSNDWEMRGVPVRLVIGPKDVDNHTVVLARRDILGKEGKQCVSHDNIGATVTELLDAIQANLLQQAITFRDANIHDVTSYDGLKEVVEAGGWARGWWSLSDDNERRIKEETGATLRCFPFDQPAGPGPCLMTGQEAPEVALFSKSY